MQLPLPEPPGWGRARLNDVSDDCIIIGSSMVMTSSPLLPRPMVSPHFIMTNPYTASPATPGLAAPVFQAFSFGDYAQPITPVAPPPCPGPMSPVAVLHPHQHPHQHPHPHEYQHHHNHEHQHQVQHTQYHQQQHPEQHPEQQSVQYQVHHPVEHPAQHPIKSEHHLQQSHYTVHNSTVAAHDVPQPKPVANQEVPTPPPRSPVIKQEEGCSPPALNSLTEPPESPTAIDKIVKLIQAKPEIDRLLKYRVEKTADSLNADPGIPADEQACDSLASALGISHPSSKGGRNVKLKLKARKFVCQFSNCPKSFKHPNQLETHMRTHTGERPFTCNWPGCDRRFSQPGNLTIHLRLHRGERPYRCGTCGKRFGQSGNLTAHMNVHLGYKRFKCPLDGCTRAFSTRGNLKVHENKYHAAYTEALYARAQASPNDLTEEEVAALAFLAKIHNNLNKGIKGRGRGIYVERADGTSSRRRKARRASSSSSLSSNSAAVAAAGGGPSSTTTTTFAHSSPLMTPTTASASPTTSSSPVSSCSTSTSASASSSVAAFSTSPSPTISVVPAGVASLWNQHHQHQTHAEAPVQHQHQHQHNNPFYNPAAATSALLPLPQGLHGHGGGGNMPGLVHPAYALGHTHHHHHHHSHHTHHAQHPHQHAGYVSGPAAANGDGFCDRTY